MLMRFTSRLDSLYSDEQEHRTARRLWTAVLALSASAVFYIPAVVGTVLQGQGVIYYIVGLAGSVSVAAGTLLLLFSERLQEAAWLQALGAWAVALFAVLLPLGVLSGAAVAAVLFYLTLSVLVLPRQNLMWLVLLYLLTILGVGVMQFPLTSPGVLVVQGLPILFAVSGISVLLVRLEDERVQSGISQQKADVTTDLLLVAHASSSAGSADKGLQQAAEVLHRLGFELVQIYKVHGERKRLDLVVAAGEPGRLQQLSGELPLNGDSMVARAVHDDEPMVAHGSEVAGEDVRRTGVISGARAVAALPMHTDGIVTGVLDLWSTTREDLLVEEMIPAMSVLADYLGQLLKPPAAPREAIQVTVADEMTEAIQEIATARSLEQVVDVLHAKALPSADVIRILSVKAMSLSGLKLETAASYTADGTLSEEAPDELAATVGDNPLVVDSVEQFSALPVVIQDYLGRALDVRSVAIFPLLERTEQPGGYLLVGYEGMHSFNDHELGMLQTLSEQIAHVLENITTMEHLQSSLTEATTLYSTSLAMSSAQNLREVYGTAMDEMAQISDADRVTAYAAGPDPRDVIEYVEAVAVWDQGVFTMMESRERYSLEDAPVLSQFPQSRANLLFSDVRNDPQLDEDTRRSFAARGVDALMLVPLSTGTTWLGALLIEGHNGKTFSDEHLRLCRNIADLSALAADLQNLLEQSRLAASRERELRAISEAIRTTSDADEILRLADKGLGEVLNRPLEVIQEARLGNRDVLPEDEWRLVQNVDRQAQLAVSNVRLLERTQQTMLQEQMISDITADLQRTTAVDDVLQTTVRTLQSMLPEYEVALRLTLPEVDELPAGDDSESSTVA